MSIKDIARAAGVSHSTVSRALRNSPLISAETRTRVQQLAIEMGYTPNLLAQGLQMQRTNTVGVIVTSIADPFFADVVEGIEEAAKPAAISVFLGASHNSPDSEIAAIEMFHRRRVDGIIIATSQLGHAHTARLEAVNVPVVLLNSQAEGAPARFTSVMVDDFAGARLAVEHLLALGHQRIGYLGVSDRQRSNAARLAGYQAALAAAGITPAAAWVAVAPWEHELPIDDPVIGEQLGHELLRSHVTAIFCYNDLIAMGLLQAARDTGRRVPQALSVVGFDDILHARYVYPPLTTMHQPKRRMGRVAMELLMSQIEGRAVQEQRFVPTLEIRASTAPPG